MTNTITIPQTVVIPFVKGEASDPTSYQCHELQELEGAERIRKAAELLDKQGSFEDAFEDHDTDGGWGTLIYTFKGGSQEFWSYCADNDLSLAELAEGFTFKHGRVWLDLADAEFDEVICDKAARFFIQANGTAAYR